VADPVSWFLIEPGWRVLDRERNEVGRVEEILADTELDIFDGLAVAGARSKVRYVPAESVAEIWEGEVRLELSRDEIDRLAEYRP
jgi:hypothetical protein